MNINNFHNWFSEFSEHYNLSLSQRNGILFLETGQFADYENQEIIFIVYEDWWVKKPEVIKSKISSIFGKNQRIFARKCTVRKIDKITGANFINDNHILESAVSKHQIGIFYKDELVSVLIFASPRNFSSGKSGELLRFCNKKFITVVGGLSKMLKVYIELYKPNNIMTYIAPEWGTGAGFKSVGFKEVSRKEDIHFYCNPKTGERIQEKHFADYENIDKYRKIKTSGSIKLVLESLNFMKC